MMFRLATTSTKICSSLSSPRLALYATRCGRLPGGISSNTRSFATTATATSSSDDKTDEIDNVFATIDTDNNGVLDKNEFRTALEQLHYSDLLKIKDSLARNELSFNPSADESKLETDLGFLTVLGRRVFVTAEVAVSKIFPAGFGWQTAATFAENAGMQATDVSFFLSTGVGDGIGVCVGHTIYMAGKKAITGDDTIDMVAQAQTGAFLGSAAVCSGGVWQPTVNLLQNAGWGFEQSLLATTSVCCLAFFTGLRLGRIVYPKIGFKGVEEGSYGNLKADAALSVAVGGAAGCFLGTDVSYEAANWLRPIVGIEETATPIIASSIAGTSTLLGFSVIQMGENLVYPKDKCWVD